MNKWQTSTFVHAHSAPPLLLLVLLLIIIFIVIVLQTSKLAIHVRVSIENKVIQKVECHMTPSTIGDLTGTHIAHKHAFPPLQPSKDHNSHLTVHAHLYAKFPANSLPFPHYA